MKILYSPQKNENEILYSFEDEKITAYYDGQSDIFDFKVFSNGVAENIESSLSLNPVVSAKREDGILYVALMYHYKKGASHREKFPTWTDHKYLEVGIYGEN